MDTHINITLESRSQKTNTIEKKKTKNVTITEQSICSRGLLHTQPIILLSKYLLKVILDELATTTFPGDLTDQKASVAVVQP